jgi:oxalate---CoA ligase
MENEERLCVRDLIINGSQDPDAPAIESPGYKPLTYRDLREQIAYVVKSLNARGLRPNDRVAIVMPNGPDAAAAILAVMAGFTLIPLNSQYRIPEYEWYFTSLDIRAVLVQRGAATEAAEAAGMHAIPVIEMICSPGKAGMFTLFPQRDCPESDTLYAEPDDTIALVQTSGTTAKPKIIPFTQKFLFSITRKMNNAFHITVSDKHLHILPLDIGLGIFSPLWGPLLEGGSVILPRDFIPPDFFGILRTCRPTYYWGGPAHHSAIVRELKKIPPEELAGHSIRFAITVSAVMDPAVLHGLEELLEIQVIEVYGMTEAPVIALNKPIRKGSVGLPIIEHIQIWDDDDIPLPAGRTGEVVVKGKLVFSGYLNAPEENAAVFKDGWLRTGDMGYFDNDGYLFLTGRIKEMINKGGRKIAPAEIDAALMSHPGVLEAMAFAIMEPVLGEDIAAMIVREQETLSEDDLRQYLLDRLLPSKIPRRIYFVDKIPKNPAGKPMRQVGTQRYS